MSTELDPKLVDRAKALDLFAGGAAYYYPDGDAADFERDHFINTVLRTALDRIEAKQAGGS